MKEIHSESFDYSFSSNMKISNVHIIIKYYHLLYFTAKFSFSDNRIFTILGVLRDCLQSNPIMTNDISFVSWCIYAKK